MKKLAALILITGFILIITGCKAIRENISINYDKAVIDINDIVKLPNNDNIATVSTKDGKMYLFDLNKNQLKEYKANEGFDKKAPKLNFSNLKEAVWNMDYSKAVVRLYSNGKEQLILVDASNGRYEHMEYTRGNVCWSQSGMLYTIEQAKGSKLKVYDTKEKKFVTVYGTFSREILYGVEWISKDKIVFLAKEEPVAKGYLEAYFHPVRYYAMKVDLAKNKVLEKQINTQYPSLYFWSSDYNYIFFKDSKGSSKSKVNFGE